MRNYEEMKKIADEFRIAFHKMPDANKEIFVKDIALGTHALVTNFLTGLDDRVFRESVLDNIDTIINSDVLIDYLYLIVELGNVGEWLKTAFADECPETRVWKISRCLEGNYNHIHLAFNTVVIRDLIEPKCKDSGPAVSNGNVVYFGEFKRGKK